MAGEEGQKEEVETGFRVRGSGVIGFRVLWFRKSW